METISYKTINDASVNDFEKLPYKIKCRGLIFKKEYNWYYSKKYSLDDIANYVDDCEIIEWEEPEEDKKIEHINKVYDLTDFRKDYPIVAEMLKDLSNKQYEIIDKVNGE